MWWLVASALGFRLVFYACVDILIFGVGLVVTVRFALLLCWLILCWRLCCALWLPFGCVFVCVGPLVVAVFMVAFVWFCL